MSGEYSDIFVKVKKTSELDDDNLLELQKFFISEYAVKPKFFVKVPGRLNIIGEHVDYCGYPVLPMTICQSLILAVCPANDDIIHLKNMNTDYKSFKCSLNSFKIEDAGKWQNYFLCGVKGVLDYITKIKQVKKKGFLVAVWGNIPAASGLSSSSALVCAAALATSYMYELPLNKQVLATIAASCERFIGTQGGGMDQAIIFLGIRGHAQFIQFNPLNATSIKLPDSCVFVVANSLSECNKAATKDFNQRVVECRLGARLVSKFMDLPWRDIDTFAKLQKSLNITLHEMETLIDKYLSCDLFTKEDLLSELEIEDAEFVDNLLTSNTKTATEFKLRQRALHVIQESIRVEKFREICNSDEENAIQGLSKLIKQSHFSLQNLYECSHPNLDQLIEISENFGVSARLTGAGWGGCIVALCESIEVCDEYIKELKKSYYDALPQCQGMNLDDVVFATSPQNGAEIYLNE